MDSNVKIKLGRYKNPRHYSSLLTACSSGLTRASFDCAQDEPFDSAQGKHFDCTQQGASH